MANRIAPAEEGVVVVTAIHHEIRRRSNCRARKRTRGRDTAPLLTQPLDRVVAKCAVAGMNYAEIISILRRRGARPSAIH
jgi:hypothetical protein